MTPAEIAKKLLEFYAGLPARWTRGVSARDKAGRVTASVHSKDAVCWCLAGAMRKLNVGASAELLMHAQFPPDPNDEVTSVIFWNDAPGRVFADVEAKLREIAGLA